jgi:hypothetical protein
MTALRQTVRLAVAILLGTAIGWLAILLIPGSHRPPIPNKADLVPGMVYADLDGVGSLRPQFTATLNETEIRRRKCYLTWNQAFFLGPLEQAYVQSLIQNGRAEALEHRLQLTERKALDEWMATHDHELRHVARLANSEVANVKSLIRQQRPDLQIVIRTKRQEDDPNYNLLLQARQMIEAKQLGAIWGDVVKGQQGVVHYIIRWREWPLLRRLYDDQNTLILARKRRVSEWISLRFARIGMGLFQT